MAQQKTQNRLIELGVSQVGANYRDLMLAVASIAQAAARDRLYKATTAHPQDDGAAGVELSTPTIAAFTDNSTGIAGTALVPVFVGVATVNPESGPTKASFDTQMGNVEDAHQELLEQANAMIGVIAGAAGRTVEATAGAAGDGTIAAISDFSNATDDTVDLTTGNAQLVIARNNQAAIAAAINYVRVALGVAPMPDASGGVFTMTSTEWETTDAAATGDAAADPGDATMTAASALLAITALKNNIATMAAAMDELIGELAIGPFIVATSQPGWKFTNTDVTL